MNFILKIRDKQQPNGWWYFATPKIHVHSTDKTNFPKDFNVVMSNTDKDFHEWSDDWEGLVAHIQLGDEQEYIIVFDTVGYLCNEKGETVEKLVPPVPEKISDKKLVDNLFESFKWVDDIDEKFYEKVLLSQGYKFNSALVGAKRIIELVRKLETEGTLRL